MNRICFTNSLGGKAVYEARSLFYLFNDTVYFNDSLLCAQKGISFRKGSESENVVSMSIFPNPNNGLFSAKILNSTVRIVHYKIYNLLGKVIVSKNTNENEIQIDLNSLNIANGLYIIEAIDENNKTYRKELSYEK